MKKILLIIILTLNLVANSIYIGVQSSSPSDGLSIKVDGSNSMAFQAIIDPFGTQRSTAIRGIYKFKENISYNLYGYGEFGFWSWDRRHYYSDEVSSFGYGLGTGVEYDLRDLDAGFIPLFVSAELNLHFFDNSRDDYYYDSEELGLGFGLHYKF